MGIECYYESWVVAGCPILSCMCELMMGDGHTGGKRDALLAPCRQELLCLEMVPSDEVCPSSPNHALKRLLLKPAPRNFATVYVSL